MSEHMRNFLKAYLVFAESNTRDNPHEFDSSCGLCSNSVQYMDSVLDAGEVRESRRDVQVELRNMFWADGLCADYPFGEDAYDTDAAHGNHHQYQPRIDWIKEKLNNV